MSLSNKGLFLSAPLDYSVEVEPLVDGDDVSWMDNLIVGDDQGQDGACAFFAGQNWEQIVKGVVRSDAEIIAMYQAYLKAHNRTEGGATFQGMYLFASEHGWFKGTQGLILTNKLNAALSKQPVIAGYEIRPAWNSVGSDGQINSGKGKDQGYHAVLIVGKGRIKEQEPRIYVENSWGADWGWNGLCSLSEQAHQDMIREMWVIV